MVTNYEHQIAGADVDEKRAASESKSTEVFTNHRDSRKNQRGRGSHARKQKGGAANRVMKALQEQLADVRAREQAEEDVKRELQEDKQLEEKKVERPFIEVVHPWKIQMVPHKVVGDHVIFESEDGIRSLPFATHADSLEGSGLVRRQMEGGVVPLPRTWADESYVKQACDLLVSEAMGKRDLELRQLVPRAVNNLRKFVPTWPTAEIDIERYLMSAEFHQKIVTAEEHKNSTRGHIMLAKILRVATKHGYTVEESREVATYLAEVDQSLFWSRVAKHFLLGFVPALPLLFFIPPLLAMLVTIVEFVAILLWHWCSAGLSLRGQALLSLVLKEQVQVNYASIINLLSSCSQGIELPPLLTKWKAVLHAGSQLLPCSIKKPFNSFGTWITGANMVVPNGCHHDQYNGLAIRFFFDRDYNQQAALDCISAAMKFCEDNILGKGKWIEFSFEEWVEHIGGKRMRMLIEEPDATLLSSFISVDIFVKLEAYLGKVVSNFKPRIIQGRMLGYQKAVGAFFYSQSKWLGTVLNKHTNYVYDNGLDANELGEIACRMFSEYKYVYEIDVSNWDGSLLPHWLDFERYFLWTIAPVLHERMEEIDRYWNNVKGSGKHGVSYSTTHGRRSGDMWTSYFNTLINICIATWIFGRDILIVAKGDDNFFGTNKKMTAKEVEAKYAELGMKAKVRLIHHISDLEYCSGKFYLTESGSWKWGLKPFRIISKLGLNLHRIPDKLHKRTLYGTALSMLPIGGHVPVLGDLLRAIVASGENKQLKAIIVDEPWKNSSSTIDRPHPAAYDFFCERYGFSMEDVEDMSFMCSFDVNTLKPLTLDHFPIVFDHPAFLRGFERDVDCVCQPSDNIEIINRPFNGRLVWAFDWLALQTLLLNVLFAPLAEEFVRSCLPLYSTVFLGGFEALFLNQVRPILVHSFFLFASLLWSWELAWFFHFLYNGYVWLSRHNVNDLGRVRVDYGSLLWLVCGPRQGTLRTRVAGLFSPMCDCLATIINRITHVVDNQVLVGSSSSWIKQRSRKSSVSQSRKSRITPALLQSQKKNLKKATSLRKSPLLRSVIDPFNPMAGGMKVPDKSAFPSVTFTINTVSRVSADANGRNVTMFLPQGKFHQINASTVAGNFTTPYDWITAPGGGDATNWASFSTAFTAYRVVSGGLRIKCDGAFINMTGRIYVVDVPLVATTWANALDFMPTTIAQAALNPQLVAEYTMTELMEHGIQATYRRVDDQSEHYIADTFPTAVKAATPAGDIFNTRGWCAKVLIFEGLPAGANCIEVHSVLHIEAVGTPVDSLVSATPPVPPQPALTTAMYTVAQAQPTAHRMDQDIFSLLSEGLDKGVSLATKAMGAYETLSPLLTALFL